MEKSDEARFSKKKCLSPNLGKKGPKWAPSLELKSLEFASIAYGNRERWYLAGGSGQSAKKNVGPSFGALFAKRAPPSVELWLNFR